MITDVSYCVKANSMGRTKGEYNPVMAAPQPKLMPTEVLRRLEQRLVKRIAALERAGAEGFAMVISELKVEMDYLKRARKYLGG
jgi:hypothetical protein